MSTGRIIPGRAIETHLGRVLFSAQRRRKTGVLTVDEGPVQTRLHLVEGRIVFAEAGTVAGTLGRILLRAGTLDRDEYMLILERMAEPSGRDEVLRFGEVAISLGMLEAAELDRALALQVHSKLTHCLQLDHAVWIWVDEETPRTTTPYPTPLEPALLEALRTDAHAPAWLERLDSRLDCVASISRRPDEIGRQFGVTARELRLLTQLQGRPLRAVLSSGVLEPESAGALVIALLIADLLELKVAEAPPPELPDPLAEPSEPERADREERARDAAARLRDEMRRRQPPQGSPHGRVNAERAFEQGKRALAHGSVERARELFERACELLPEAADYVLYARWTRYLTASDPARRATCEQDVRAAMLEALRQDRTMTFAHYVQGRLCMIEGDERAAERALSIAARLDPSDVDTARYLRLLRARLH